MVVSETLEEARKRMRRYLDKGKSPEDDSTDPAEYGRGKRQKQSVNHVYGEESESASKRSKSIILDDDDLPNSPVFNKKGKSRPEKRPLPPPPPPPVSHPQLPRFFSSEEEIRSSDDEDAQRIGLASPMSNSYSFSTVQRQSTSQVDERRSFRFNGKRRDDVHFSKTQLLFC